MKGFRRLLARRTLLNPIKEKSGSSLVRSSRAFSCSAIFSPFRGPVPSALFGQPKTSSFVPTNFFPWIGLQVQRRSMFIQTQSTPNPLSLMFYPGKPVMEIGSSDFPNARAAMTSPLAKALFGIDGITRVFFGADFISVTKSDEASWDFLKPEIFAAIMDFYTSAKPLFLDSNTASSMDTSIQEIDGCSRWILFVMDGGDGVAIRELLKWAKCAEYTVLGSVMVNNISSRNFRDDSEIVAMIKELLETRIRPAVQDDGGNIEYCGFDEETGIVKLKLQGACSGCPSSSVTLKSGIENMLMHYVPEVKGVEQELDNPDEEMPLTSQLD